MWPLRASGLILRAWSTDWAWGRKPRALTSQAVVGCWNFGVAESEEAVRHSGEDRMGKRRVRG